MVSQAMNENVGNMNLTRWQVIRDCWSRSRERMHWYCDPEGPSAILFFRDVLFRWLGIVVFIFGLIIVVWTIPYATELIEPPVDCNPCESSCLDLFRYLGFGLLLAGGTSYVIGSHSKKVELKTAVFNEEIDNIVREVKTKADMCNAEGALTKNVEEEIKRLEFFKKKPTEVRLVRLIALRKLHVGLCDKFEELKTLAESDMDEYGEYVGADNRKLVMYRSRFDTTYREYDRIFNTGKTGEQNESLIAELQGYIKELREEIQWEKHSAGQGEAIVRSFTYWSLVASFSLLMLGITPLLHTPMLTTELSVVHWGLLGMAGAIIYTASKMRAKEASELGFEEGNTELRKMLLGIVIGGITAILFYAAIRSEVFGGKILPKFEDIANTQGNNLLAVFWAVLAGYSAKLSERLLGSSEKVLST